MSLIGYGLLFMGQSNMTGPDASNVPPGIPDSTIPMELNDYFYDDGTHLLGDLRVSIHGGSHSHEIRLAQRLKAAGFPVSVAKLTQGATFINRWPPGVAATAPGAKVYIEIQQWVAQLPAAFPLVTEWRYIWVWDQGEAEARYGDLPTVQHWSVDYTSIKAGVTAALGVAPVVCLVMRTWSSITGKTFPGVMEAEQASVCDSITSFCVDTNDLAYRGDGVHRLATSQNTLGDRNADIVIPLITPPLPANSVTAKVRLYQPTRLGLRLTLPQAIAAHWTHAPATKIFNASRPQLRLRVGDATVTQPGTLGPVTIPLPSGLAGIDWKGVEGDHHLSRKTHQ